MLPHAAQQAIDQVGSSALLLMAIAVASSVLGVILAMALGGKSRAKRKVIYTLSSLTIFSVSVYISMHFFAENDSPVQDVVEKITDSMR